MKPIEKLDWLATLELQTEGFIEDAVVYFQNLDERMLNVPSPSGGWSIAQCLEHLNTYGDYYLTKLQSGIKAQANKPNTEVYICSCVGALLIKLTDPKMGRLKLKAARRHHPSSLLLAHLVVADFIDQQETMLSLLRAAKVVDINQFKIPLSVTSWVSLSVGEILHFMVVHTQRHIMQAKRNVSVVPNKNAGQL